VLQDIQAAIDHAAKAGRQGGHRGLLLRRLAVLALGLRAARPERRRAVLRRRHSTIPAEVARSPKVPVLAHYGDRDKHIPVDTVQAFSQAHPEVTVHVYEANHGFNCDDRGSYDAPAAKLARERTLAFFNQHLG
jgi:carboxymethylenebutenolidase